MNAPKDKQRQQSKTPITDAAEVRADCCKHHPTYVPTYVARGLEERLNAALSSCAASEGWRSMDEPLEYITKSDDPNIQFVNRVEMPKHARGWKLAIPESEQKYPPTPPIFSTTERKK